jgi:hypothetical protein
MRSRKRSSSAGSKQRGIKEDSICSALPIPNSAFWEKARAEFLNNNPGATV